MRDGGLVGELEFTAQGLSLIHMTLPTKVLVCRWGGGAGGV